MKTRFSDRALAEAVSIVQQANEHAVRRPLVESFFHAPTSTISHIVRDPSSDSCAVIDSVLDFDQPAGRTTETSVDLLIQYLRTRSLRAEWLLETHAHADHLSAAPVLREQVGGRLAIGERITVVQETFAALFNLGASFARNGSQFDHLFHDGERFMIGGLDGIALHVPGHTPACMAYVIGDAVFPGDTLFMPDYGTARCDFPGGGAAALYRSIRRLQALPDESRVFLCHDYKAPGRDNFVWETTIGAERATNIYVREGVGEAEFVARREARDKTLGVPALLLPSIQVNIRGGRLPDPEDNGVRYLKLPLNAL
jgi:glyoxylase-like metal-dependent hydrolase (beta-lactamase superfamily II)